MDTDNIFSELKGFNDSTHGTTTYHKDEFYVCSVDKKSFAPLSFMKKKVSGLSALADLIREGFICDSLDLLDNKEFSKWFETNFSRKLKRTQAKGISLLYLPDNRSIFDAVENINKSYEVLRCQKVFINGKKMPVQLGEWYVKCIFGLHQKKSSSQRGFDFYFDDKRVEVKVYWGDYSSPKGVKLKKSLVGLSDFTVIMYMAKNLMIREICFLDSEFVMRKFTGKGHTIFLKDSDIESYFFSKSRRNIDKVVNSTSLMRFSSPSFAMKLTDKFS